MNSSIMLNDDCVVGVVVAVAARAPCLLDLKHILRQNAYILVGVSCLLLHMYMCLCTLSISRMIDSNCSMHFGALLCWCIPAKWWWQMRRNCTRAFSPHTYQKCLFEPRIQVSKSTLRKSLTKINPLWMKWNENRVFSCFFGKIHRFLKGFLLIWHI